MSPTLGQVLNQIKNTAGPVWDCGVLGLSADEKAGGLQIVLESVRVLQQAQLEAAAAEIKRAYGIENFLSSCILICFCWPTILNNSSH